ncbi:MAG: DUF58 domain-containing protein [Phycisphaerae bacterium]
MNATPRYLQPDVLARLGGLEVRARAVVEGFVSGMHRSPYHGSAVEFAEHRAYVPGDDLRHLDWRVMARTDRLLIKEYEEETNLRTHLLVDGSASMRYPESPASGRWSKFEYAATLAASLAFLLTHQQDSVGLLLFDDQVRSELPPLSSPAHLRAIVDALERARLERPDAPDQLDRQLAPQLRRRALVVLISDLLFPPAALARVLDRLRFDRHETLVMHVLDADERTFPFSDLTRFEGLERLEPRVTVDAPSLRSAYLAALEDHLRAVRTCCRARRADLVELTTSEPLDVALRRYLAARSHFTQR